MEVNLHLQQIWSTKYVQAGTYFHNEPLFLYGTKQFRTLNEASEVISVVKRMIKCNHHDLENHFESQRKHFGSRNTLLWKNCNYEENEDLCYDTKVTSRLYKLFPFQNVKLERLRLGLVEEILKDRP